MRILRIDYVHTCRGNTRVRDVVNLWEYVLTLLDPMEEPQLKSDKLSVVDFIPRRSLPDIRSTRE